ncbi:hypothetical protein GCM10022399_42380 [Terrabacter ginsenosidimutans]|uniref:Uncharacterized protein n=1 Tax=Terrabacter ginsenosidimutans TaxID=490575 RepID=A0ABP7EPQ8_9MICO
MSNAPPVRSEVATPPAILEAAVAAEAARAWASTVPAPAADSDSQNLRDLPASAWCARPPTADEQQAEALRAEKERESQPDPVEVELDQLASHLVGRAYYRNRSTFPELGMVPVAKPTMSVEARRRAHGCRIGRVRIWKYFSKQAFVCLDCQWIGEPVPAQVDGVEPDASAAAEHPCRSKKA